MKIAPIRIVSGIPDAGYRAEDDLRHRPSAGGNTRESLFWEVMLPEQEIGFQAYLYLTSEGYAGFNVIVWGREKEPLVLDLVDGKVEDDMDFDAFEISEPQAYPARRLGGACAAHMTAFITLSIRFRWRMLNPSGRPKSDSPQARQSTACKSARRSIKACARVSTVRRVIEDCWQGIGDDKRRAHIPSRRTARSETSSAWLTANTLGTGTPVPHSAPSTFASRSTSLAPFGNGGGGGRRSTTALSPSLIK
jgi:hypothetical protein